jgi:transcriptional regulator of acetoin/glycerol metabolism
VLAVAAPKLDDLYAMIGHCGCGILLTDAEGLVLDARAGAARCRVFRPGACAGVDWSEAAQGTNGIGTCIAERRALTIHRDQHYLAENIGMSCIDAPVFGPDGGLIAALDVSSARADQTEGFNRLIEAMVTRVAPSHRIRPVPQAYPKHRIVLADGADPASAALLAVDSDDVVVGATRDARRRHGLEPAGLIRPRPVVDLLGRDSGHAGSGRRRTRRSDSRPDPGGRQCLRGRAGPGTGSRHALPANEAAGDRRPGLMCLSR